MYEIDAALTHAINGLAGQSSTLDLLMIWFSNVGVYLMVLAVVTQWWRGPDRAHIRHIVVAAGFSFYWGWGSTNSFFSSFIAFGRMTAG